MSYRKMSYRKIISGFLAASMSAPLAVGAARAADLDYGYGAAPPPPDEEKVEFGSGWYVRGDIAAVKLPSVRAITAKVGDYPNFSVSEGSKAGYTASLGGGYQFNNWFRTDLLFDFHEPLKANTSGGNVFCPTGIYYSGGTPHFFSGGCTSNFVARLNSYDVLINGYIDLGRWSVITPYVGAGAGLGFGHYAAASSYIQGNGLPYHVTFSDPKTGAVYYNNYDRSSSGSYYSFAYALMAGFAVDVFDHTKLDIGYRYLHAGKVLGLDLDTHEVHAGLRYLIDN